MKSKIVAAGVLGVAFSLAGTAHAQNMMQLTAQDYIDIQMLSARYAQVTARACGGGIRFASGGPLSGLQ